MIMPIPNMKKCTLLLYVFFCMCWNPLLGQGCSDAGFCNAGTFNAHSDSLEKQTHKNSMHFAMSYELGEQGTQFFIPQISLNLKLGDKDAVQLKLPFQIASGNLGSNSGFGDVIVSYSRLVLDKNKFNLHGLLGARLALNNANQKIDNKPLPMPYQTSLGTYDLILGTRSQYHQWLFTVGAQIPVIHNNENQYVPEDFPDESAYFNSYQLRRKADLMLKVERRISFQRGFVQLGILPIYHISDDEVQLPNANSSNSIKGSEGLTLNAIGKINYQISSRFYVEIVGGAPLTVRDKRPDGLTRNYVIQPGLRYQF